MEPFFSGSDPQREGTLSAGSEEQWPPPLPDLPPVAPAWAEKGDEDYYRRDIDRQPGEGLFEWVGRRWRLWREARSG